MLRWYYLDREGCDPSRSRSEIWCLRSAGARWEPARRIDLGHSYTGAMNSAIQMRCGRILLPYSYLSERTRDRFVATLIYSDDNGDTWLPSPSNLLVESGSGILESGAIEPVVEEVEDGRVMMLIRTQKRRLYQSLLR